MSAPFRGMRKRRVRAKEARRHEATSISTAEPKAMASKTAKSQRTSAASASSMEVVIEPTAPSTSPRFEPLLRSKQLHTRLPLSPKIPLPPSEEWTLSRCKPTSGTKRILQRSREKAKPTEYSGCSLGNGLFHSKLILSSCTTDRYDFIPTQ